MDLLTKDLKSHHTFENFICTKFNEYPLKIAREVAVNRNSIYNPLLIIGPMGSGKTHLISAITNYIIKEYHDTNYVFIKGKNFVNTCGIAIFQNNRRELKQKFIDSDFIAIDDVHNLSGDEDSQKILIEIMDNCLFLGKQLVFTSLSYPKTFLSFHPALKSRLQSGLTVSILWPDKEGIIEILKKFAIEKGIALSNDISYYLADIAGDNLKNLMELWHQCILTCAPLEKELTLSSIRKVLSLKVNDVQKRVRLIKEFVAKYFAVSIDDLSSNKRNKNIVQARQIAMYLTRRLTGISFNNIGKYFGNRDHSTVMYAIRKVKNSVEKDVKMRLFLSELENQIRGSGYLS